MYEPLLPHLFLLMSETRNLINLILLLCLKAGSLVISNRELTVSNNRYKLYYFNKFKLLVFIIRVFNDESAGADSGFL